jgi:hypothetical protein
MAKAFVAAVEEFLKPLGLIMRKKLEINFKEGIEARSKEQGAENPQTGGRRTSGLWRETFQRLLSSRIKAVAQGDLREHLS